MALEVRPLNSKVQIRFDLGTDTQGKKISRTKTISNIKYDATDQDVFDVVEALIGLQEHRAEYIHKIDQSELEDVQ